jgi:DNA-directed RNA polymerase specialized sigma24 family protein
MPASKSFAPGEDSGDPSDRGLLRGRSPRDVLLRIADGDPLEIVARVDAALEEQGMLLAPERVQVRSLARIAYVACSHGAPQVLGPWLREIIEACAGELLEEDREAEHDGDPLPRSSETYAAMTLAFGVEHSLARRMSVVFHDMPILQRRIIQGIVREGSSLEELATRLGQPLAEIHAGLRAAVESLQVAAGSRLAGRLGGGGHG